MAKKRQLGKFCKQCLKQTHWTDGTYCSLECKVASKPSRPCVHCGGGPKPIGQRATCSDACVFARRAALADASSHYGQRSVQARATKRKYNKSGYKKRDKAEQIAHYMQHQKGLCAVCAEDGGSRGLVLDHCHTTGRARALLCGRCNAALGLVKEHPGKARNLMKYAEWCQTIAKNEREES